MLNSRGIQSLMDQREWLRGEGLHVGLQLPYDVSASKLDACCQIILPSILGWAEGD